MTELVTERLENKAAAGAGAAPRRLFAELMGAFEEFKRTNDGRLAELEQRGSTDALTEEKLGAAERGARWGEGRDGPRWRWSARARRWKRGGPRRATSTRKRSRPM